MDSRNSGAHRFSDDLDSGGSDKHGSPHRPVVESVRRLTWRDAVAAAIIIGALILALVLGISAVTQLQEYAAADRIQNALISKQSDTINKLRNQVFDLGKTPVAEAPSKSEVEKAQKGLQGAQGPKGDPGENATDQQVSDAVRDYCLAHGGCMGVAGQNGSAGPGPTDDQISAAVASFCAANGGCVGPAGAPGAPGSQGEPGPAGSPGADGATYVPVSQTCILDGSSTVVQTVWQNSVTGSQTTTSYRTVCLP